MTHPDLPILPGTPPAARGRGAQFDPPNRFARIHVEREWEYLEHDEDAQHALEVRATQYFSDRSRTIFSENDSPDIPYRYSINPYRGCSHGCSYCYARPYHEYLDLGAGLDFETKIFVKEDAAKLFRDWLARPGYVPEPVMFSGVTDCYQPIERKFQLTRQCLEVALEARQPVGLITKNALITRDTDLLSQLAALNVGSAAISLTSLDQSLTKVMEPRTSSPQARLRAIRGLVDAGVRMHVNLAPIIPGLNDSEIPALLEAARDAGATSAAFILLRLPLAVEPIFVEWLERNQPLLKEKVLSRIRNTRDGKLYQSQFGKRMKGEGQIADQIHQTFQVFSRKLGFNKSHTPIDLTRFQPPTPSSGQRWLFT